MHKRARLSLLLVLCLLLSLLVSCGGGGEYGNVDEGELRIHFFDVGQGDAALIRTAEAVILVDTGDVDPEITEELLKKLRDQGIAEIDCLVLTHPHADHIGGAAEILAEFPVGECLMPNAVSEGDVFSHLLDALFESGATVTEAYAGRTFTYGDVTVEVLAPGRRVYAELNDYSVVLRIVFGECSILMTGDAELVSEAEMLAAFGSDGLSATLLKVPHHGADTSLSDELLAAVAPEYAVISCGAGNFYGHPHPDTLKKLARAGVRVLRTDTSGDVVFLWDGEELILQE